MLFLLSVFTAAFALTAGLLSVRLKYALQLERRVNKVMADGQAAHPYGTFFHLSRTIMERISERALRFSPQRLIDRTERQLRSMGLRGSTALKKWLAVKLSWAVLTVIAMAVVVLITRSALSVLLAVIIVTLSLLLFRFMLKRRVLYFQQAIRKQLPNLLDMLTISVEAGLGFEQALERNSHHLPLELGREVRQILAEINLGKSRRDALRDAVARIGVEEFASFVNAVIQADRLGMGIANVLRVQATETRRRLGEKVKEQAMKAPIKILFPLVLFLFPALFIIILGPAMLRIASIFIK